MIRARQPISVPQSLSWSYLRPQLKRELAEARAQAESSAWQLAEMEASIATMQVENDDLSRELAEARRDGMQRKISRSRSRSMQPAATPGASGTAQWLLCASE
jgi:chromosome condensin MukBEF ATPase and DNA-binding subunit MukB